MSNYNTDSQKMWELVMKPMDHLLGPYKQDQHQFEKMVFELKHNSDNVSENTMVMLMEWLEALAIRIFNEWLHVSGEQLTLIGEMMEMFNSSWTAIDDIHDNTMTRRDHQTSHLVYGTNFCTLSAICALFDCASRSFQFHPEAPKIFVEGTKNIFVGVAKECYWKDHHYCPSEDEYIELCDERVGTYLRLIAGCMQLVSDNKTDISHFCRLLSIYMQVYNDYWNLMSKSYNNMKGFAEDLTEGKFSFPLLHAAARSKEVYEIVQMKTHDVEVKKRCLHLVHECGSIKHTRNKIKELEQAILAECKKLGGNTIVENFIKRSNQIFFPGD